MGRTQGNSTVAQDRLDAYWVLEGLEHLQEMVVVTNTGKGGDGLRILYVNAAFERVTGWPRAEAVGRSPKFLQGPRSDPTVIAEIAAALDAGRALEVELINYARDGREYLTRLNIKPVRDGHGVLTSFIALQADLTEERERDADSRRMAEWFEGAAASSPDALYILTAMRDGGGRITDFRFAYANRRGGELLRCRAEDLIGRPMCERLPPSRVEALMEQCREVMATGISDVAEFEVAEYPAEMRWLRHQVVPLSDGVAITSSNITRRKLAELAMAQREQMLQSFLDNCPGMAWICDDRGNTLAANGSYRELMQQRGCESLPATFLQMYPPEMAELYIKNNLRIADSGQAERVLEPSPRMNGTMGLFESFKFPLGERDGVRLLGGIAIDISEREGEHQAAERLAALVRSSGDAILALDLAGNIVSWNLGAQQLFGYLEAEALGSPISMLSPPKLRAESDAMIAKVLAGAPLVRYRTTRVSRDGARVHVQLSLSAISDRDGRCVGLSEIASDVGESLRREEQSRYFAEHDPVTGTLNERGMLLSLSRTLEALPASSFAVLRLAVDRYSEFRDAFGVIHADELLTQVAARLEQALPGAAHEIGHLGQNQFAMLVSCDAPECLDINSCMGRLVEAMDPSLEVLGIEVDVGLHCGAALYPGHGTDAETLLRCADLALGQVQRTIEAGYGLYEPAMGEQVAFKVRLQQELSRAIVRGQLRVVMQPIFDACSPARAVGMEALVRWSHPELGNVPPSQFIPVAEESGLIVDIGGFVMREACRIKSRLDGAGCRDLFLSVNVSRDQFRRGNLPELLAAVLADTGVSAAQLELEITEGVLMEHTVETERQLKALSRLGVGLTVDDFVTGYSSLAYLQRFPVTKLKIDQTFVTALPDDRSASEIVRTILTLARSLDLVSVAEGVETRAQRDALLAMGCTQYQGFLLSLPVEESQLLQALGRGGGSSESPALEGSEG